MLSQKQRLMLGAHISVAGGLEQAIVRGDSIGCTTIQIFTKSNRQWQAKPISDQEAELFKKTQQEHNISPIIAHATYLINIGSPDTETRQKSVAAVVLELERCSQLGVTFLVLHPGSHLKSGEQEAINTITESLDTIFDKYTGSTKVLLEIMAGQGSSVCYSFEQLAFILKKVTDKSRLGVCFDTCHAFAAGYDFRTPETYTKLWNDFDKIIGLTHLKAIHLNDSKKELGSRVDRHDHIGKGTIGLTAFSLLFNDERFFDIPKILETPADTLEDYAKEIKIIMGLLSKETKEKLNIK